MKVENFVIELKHFLRVKHTKPKHFKFFNSKVGLETSLMNKDVALLEINSVHHVDFVRRLSSHFQKNNNIEISKFKIKPPSLK